jgi:hypothetical protein
MSIPASLLLAFLLQPAAVAAAEPSITHERQGANGYRLRLIIPTPAGAEAGARLLNRTVRSLCGALHPHYGRWQIAAPLVVANPAAPPPAADVTQEVTCEAAPAPASSASAAGLVDPNWAATAADEQALRSATEAFFEARDAGRFEVAYGFLSPGFGGGETIDAFRSEGLRFNREAGPKIGRRLAAVTWYNNNLGGAPPGIYAAVDFAADYQALHFSCGYVIWRLQPDRSWKLVTVNQAVVSRAAAPGATAEELATIRSRVGCRA